MNGRALIQIQQPSGTWQTINECDTDPTTIRVRLDDAVRAHKTRVRAISKETGAIIDFR